MSERIDTGDGADRARQEAQVPPAEIEVAGDVEATDEIPDAVRAAAEREQQARREAERVAAARGGEPTDPAPSEEPPPAPVVGEERSPVDGQPELIEGQAPAARRGQAPEQAQPSDIQRSRRPSTGMLQPTPIAEFEAQTGLERGEEFVVRERTIERGPDQVATTRDIELTEQGQIELAGRPERGQTALDEAIERGEEITGVDPFPGEGDVVQEAEAELREAAVATQLGEGVIPSAEQAETGVREAFAAAPGEGEIVPQDVAVGAPVPLPREEQTVGFARRGAETANVPGLVLGAGRFTEDVGEFGFNLAVAETAPAGTRVESEAERRAREQLGSAGQAIEALGASTAEAVTERPAQTAGSAAFELGAAAAGARVSPVRTTRFDVPMEAGETTRLRGLQVDIPGTRTRTIAGARGVRPTVGAPSVELSEVAFRELGEVENPTPTFEPATGFETAVVGRSVREQGAPEDVARFEAAQELIDVGAETGDVPAARTAEETFAGIEGIDTEAAGRVAETLREEDAQVFGSAASAVQLEEARRPGDIDIVVADEAAIRERLGEELEGTGVDVADFDIKERGARTGLDPGDVFGFGRQTREPVASPEGIPIQPVGEQLERKAGASAFIRGEAFGPDVEGFDVGPTATRFGTVRTKDVADALALAEGVGETRGRGLFGRRGTDPEAAAARFEAAFGEELAEVGEREALPPPADRPGAVETGAPLPAAIEGEGQALREFLTGAERGQVDLGGFGGRRGARDLDVDVDRGAADAMARLTGGDLPDRPRSRSPSRARGDAPSGVGVSPSPLADLDAPGSPFAPPSTAPGTSLPGSGAAASVAASSGLAVGDVSTAISSLLGGTGATSPAPGPSAPPSDVPSVFGGGGLPSIVPSDVPSPADGGAPSPSPFGTPSPAPGDVPSPSPIPGVTPPPQPSPTPTPGPVPQPTPDPVPDPDLDRPRPDRDDEEERRERGLVSDLFVNPIASPGRIFGQLGAIGAAAAESGAATGGGTAADALGSDATGPALEDIFGFGGQS